MVWMHRMSVADVISFAVQTLAVGLICVFAWRRGGPGERFSGGVFGLLWIIGCALTLSGPGYDPPLSILGDVLAGAAFLYATVRYNRLWLGLGLIAQGLQLGLRVLDVVLPETPGAVVWVAIGVGINLMNLVMMAAIAGSTIAYRPPDRSAQQP